MNPVYHASCKSQVTSVPVPRTAVLTAKALYCPRCERELVPAELLPRGGFTPPPDRRRPIRYRFDV